MVINEQSLTFGMTALTRVDSVTDINEVSVSSMFVYLSATPTTFLFYYISLHQNMWDISV